MLEHNSPSKTQVEFNVSVSFQALKERGELHSCRTRNLVLPDFDLCRADGYEDLGVCHTYASCCFVRLISSSSRTLAVIALPADPRRNDVFRT